MSPINQNLPSEISQRVREIINELNKYGISAENVEPDAQLKDFWNVIVGGFDLENITQEYKKSIKGPTSSESESIKGKNLQVKYTLFQNEQVLLLKGSSLRNIGITLINPQIIHGLMRPMPVFDFSKPKLGSGSYLTDEPLSEPQHTYGFGDGSPYERNSE